jgi:hypothetical protein
VADERNGPVICPPGIRKLTLEPEHLGLFMAPDSAWRCGDYVLYTAMQALPDARAFWLIEPDVRIHSNDLKSFFDGRNGGADADFLTAWFTVSSPAWAWHASIQPFVAQVYNCMLQLSRFSRNSVEHLLKERLKLSDVYRSRNLPAHSWPNDEAFVGATLKQGGFSVGTLSQHAPDYTSAGTFGFTKPVSALRLDRSPADECIYHPVVGGRKFLQRAQAYLEERKAAADSAASLCNEFDSAFLSQLKSEAGEIAATRFYRQVLDAAALCEERAGQRVPA